MTTLLSALRNLGSRGSVVPVATVPDPAPTPVVATDLPPKMQEVCLKDEVPHYRRFGFNFWGSVLVVTDQERKILRYDRRSVAVGPGELFFLLGIPTTTSDRRHKVTFWLSPPDSCDGLWPEVTGTACFTLRDGLEGAWDYEELLEKLRCLTPPHVDALVRAIVTRELTGNQSIQKAFESYVASHHDAVRLARELKDLLSLEDFDFVELPRNFEKMSVYLSVPTSVGTGGVTFDL